MGRNDGVITVFVIMGLLGLLSACLAFAGEVMRSKNSEVQFLSIGECLLERRIPGILAVASAVVLIFTKIVSSFQLCGCCGCCGCPPPHVIWIAITAWLLVAADLYIVERVVDPNNFLTEQPEEYPVYDPRYPDLYYYRYSSYASYTPVKCFAAKRGLLGGAGTLAILIISMEIICRVLLSRTPEPLPISPQVVVQPTVPVHTQNNGQRSSER